MCSEICGPLHWMQQTARFGCAVLMHIDIDYWKRTSKTHAVLHAARCAARGREMQIGRDFCCTSKTHVTAADGSLHIQTAHRNCKCNRPLKYILRNPFVPTFKFYVRLIVRSMFRTINRTINVRTSTPNARFCCCCSSRGLRRFRHFRIFFNFPWIIMKQQVSVKLSTRISSLCRRADKVDAWRRGQSKMYIVWCRSRRCDNIIEKNT